MEGPGTGNDTGANDNQLDAVTSTSRRGGKEGVDVSGHVSEGIWPNKGGASWDGNTGDPNAAHSPLRQHGVPDRNRGKL